MVMNAPWSILRICRQPTARLVVPRRLVHSEIIRRADRGDVDRSIIRIHTMHRWPEAIVFDTRLPTITPPPVITAEVSAKRTPHDALALLPQAPPPAATYAPVVEAKPVAMKRRSKTARVATRRIASYRAAGSGDVFLAGW
jgi:hypothetical protein